MEETLYIVEINSVKIWIDENFHTVYQAGVAEAFNRKDYQVLLGEFKSFLNENLEVAIRNLVEDVDSRLKIYKFRPEDTQISIAVTELNKNQNYSFWANSGTLRRVSISDYIKK